MKINNDINGKQTKTNDEDNDDDDDDDVSAWL